MANKLYKIDKDQIQRLKKSCPRCGAGTYLANHNDRLSCGRCGYTEFKKK